MNLPDKNPEGQLFLAVLFVSLYFYSLLKALSEKGMEIDQSTLYPLLRRLESQGLPQSDWSIVDEARPRRYYVISLQGKAMLAKLKKEWSGMAETMRQMLS